ncbi:hypothetical protein ZWY2020_017251 [Hordeum vulgare]|nr:hypothetical protein ZWY2020_017251 [Hordeum vulgare]
MHDLDKNYQNSEHMLVNQRANEHGHGDQQPESEQMLLNNEEAMLKQDAEEQVENEQLLPHPATDVNHRIKEEQMLLDDVTVVHDLDHCDLNRSDGLNFFKRFLGRGFLKHVQDNGLLQDIFNIKADKAETLSSNDKERKNAALFDE